MSRQICAGLTTSYNSDTRAHVSRSWWQCLGCYRRILTDSPPAECNRCEMQHGYVRVADSEVLRGRAALSPDSHPLEYQAAPDWADIWPQGVPRGAVQLWSGEPGAGKSRLGLRFCTSLGVTACLSLEMSSDITIDTARKCGADLSRLWLYEHPAAFWNDLPTVEPACVLVDSIQHASPSLLARLTGWCRVTPGILVLISQVNSHGRVRGGTSQPHGVDAVFKVVSAGLGKARITTAKNRLGLPTAPVVYSLGASDV